MTNLRTRALQAGGESGFTLIELIVVVLILGLLLGIAVPSYIGLTQNGEHAAAEANVREAVPAVEAFYADNGTYVGLDNAATAATPGLKNYDQATGAKVVISSSPAPSQGSYCIYSTTGASTYFKKGPGGDITRDPGPVRGDCDIST
ncbi:MAG: prepilin-type N-terminal cleavage/methylation domain-containing protein [Gaiellaceae bacterium]